MTQEQFEQIKNLFEENGVDVDLDYDFDHEEINSFKELQENCQENNRLNVEITYYGSAMEYLTENDNSLRESLGIAAEMGFECGNLNSETLASLLATRNNEEAFDGLEDEIEEILNQSED